MKKPQATVPTYKPESIQLYCKSGSSDKVYNIQLTQTENGWNCLGQGGRRGSTLTDYDKVINGTYEEAKTAYDRTIHEKLHKSPPYRVVEGAISESAPLTNGKRIAESVPSMFTQPELLTRATDAQVDAFAKNSRYVFQPKRDGRRLTVHYRGKGDLVGYNRSGEAIQLDAQLYKAILWLVDFYLLKTMMLDGEWEADGFHTWDILEGNSPAPDGSYRNYAYHVRLSTLESLLEGLPKHVSSIVHIIETARTTEEKQAMLANKKLEGVGIKDRTAIWRSGRAGQHWKKKHEPTASFIVGPKTAAKIREEIRLRGKESRSVAIYLEQRGKLRFMCTVKVADKYALPKIGDVIDVRYLYAYPGPEGGLVQPAYFGVVRDDVKRESCTPEQLRIKNGGEEEEAA